MKSIRAAKTLQITYIGVLTAVLCILGPIAIPLPFSPVPVSFTNLALYIMVLVVSRQTALLSCFLYLLTGAVGLPVFSGFSGGLGKIAGPTGGYLIGFLFLILIAGYFTEHFPQKKVWISLGMSIGTVICYVFGTVWLCIQMGLPFLTGLSLGVLPYIPLDLIKIAAGVLIGSDIRKRLRDAA